MNDNEKGMKLIEIHAQTRFPIVSAYEFEFLKTDPTIQSLIKPCTVYFIVQRPLLYLNNVCVTDGAITFEIRDDSPNAPLNCTFTPSPSTYGLTDDLWYLECHFYKKTADATQPYNNVAVFKLVDKQGRVLDWLSPGKLMYQFFDGREDLTIDGDHSKYRDYTVHYIGQAFDQNVWERLTGHEKMQSILTLEEELNTQSLRAPFEISLLLLEIDGYTEMPVIGPCPLLLSPETKPIPLQIDDAFMRPSIPSRAPQLTNEVEAMLIRQFRPVYNTLKYAKYPCISNGTRSVGYTQSSLIIERMPALLRTDHHSIIPIGSKTN